MTDSSETPPILGEAARGKVLGTTRFAWFGGAVAGAAIAGVIGVMIGSSMGGPSAQQLDETQLRAALSTALEGATISHIQCGIGPDLCEVLAGDTLLYVDRSGRYGMAGNLLDFQSRQDMTAVRREQLRQFAGVLDGQPVQVAAARPSAPSGAPAPQAAQPQYGNISVDLPLENAVVYRGGLGLPVINVFSDLTCPFCQRLHGELQGLENYEVREYLVEWLGRGGGERAQMVLCSEDRADAATNMYEAGSVSITRTREECSAQFGPMIEQNTAFARSFGMEGTPTMIFQDGRRYAGGYAPAADIERWAGAS